jgi:hypothetical protein
MKNYFAEERTLPEEFFNQICNLTKINQKKLKLEKLENNFGQIKGGKISKRRAKDKLSTELIKSTKESL